MTHPASTYKSPIWSGIFMNDAIASLLGQDACCQVIRYTVIRQLMSHVSLVGEKPGAESDRVMPSHGESTCYCCLQVSIRAGKTRVFFQPSEKFVKPVVDPDKYVYVDSTGAIIRNGQARL